METNAYLLGEELTLKLLKAGLSSTIVSLKAQQEELHHFYTGVSPRLILENFHKAYKLGLNLEVVSVFIPDLVEKEEIEKIAQFVSSIDLKIPYTVIPFIPVPQAEWWQPRSEEIKEAAGVAKKYLAKVEIDERRRNPVPIESIYPKLSFCKKGGINGTDFQ